MRALLLASLALSVAAASAQEVRPRLVPQIGHRAGIAAAAFGPDGRYALTAGSDGAAVVWDAATGAEVARLLHAGRAIEGEGFAAGLYDAAFLPDGRAVTLGVDGTVWVWDVAARRPLHTLDLDPFYEPHLSPDATRLGARSDTSLALWDVATGEPTAEIPLGERSGPTAFSPDGARLAMVSDGLAVDVWDAATGEALARIEPLEPERTWPWRVRFTPDGERLVVLFRDEGVRVVDLAGGRLAPVPSSLDGEVAEVSYSVDGTHVVVGRAAAGEGGGGPLPTGLRGPEWPEVWDQGEAVEVWAVGGAAPAFRVPLSSYAALGPDGRRLLTHTYAGAALWDVADGSLTAELGARLRVPSSGAFLDRGRRIVADGVWALPTGEWAPFAAADAARSEYTEDADGWRAVAPEADRVLVVDPDEGVAAVWRLGDAAPLLELPPNAAATYLPVVALRGDGARLAAADEGRVRVWDVDAAAVAVEIETPEPRLWGVAYSADGRRLVTRAPDGAGHVVRVWDAETGAPLAALRPPGLDDWDELAISPDGARLASSTLDSTAVWDAATGARLATLPGILEPGAAATSAFSADGRRLFLTVYRPAAADEPFEAVPTVWDVERGAVAVALAPVAPMHLLATVAFGPTGRDLLTVELVPGRHDDPPEHGAARLWDAETGALRHTLTGLEGGPVGGAAFSPDGTRVLVVGLDGTLQLWDAETGDAVAGLLAFTDGTWAVVDAEGRYDASDGGDVDGLAWALDAPGGLEPVRLAQLKARYYDPGLLAKHLGFNAEPLRDVAVFRERGVALYPEVALAEAAPEAVTLRLTNRGGGIGAVAVFVNGTRVVEDARPPGADPAADALTVAVDLRPFRRLFLPDTLNTVAATAANAEGSLVSRRRAARVFVPAARGTDEEAPEAAPDYAPRLWAVLVGVGEYAGDALDLRFAGTDAADVAAALGVAAPRLFGPERTHLTLLTTDPGGDGPPTRDAILEALAAVAERADARDVLLVYLAGHGVVHGGADGDFFFLTRDAASGDLADAAVREAVAVSAAELEARLAGIPALKRVLILDTCASGRVVERLSARRDVPGAQVRSLDRLKDHTGTFVLAGSAADAVSYEASQYGQGLLTWSLLEGLRLAADADDHAVDVLAWFDHAQRRVPELARSIGGIQRPELVMPSGRGSYPVGRVLPEDQARIPLQTPRPVVLRASFQDEATFGDPLGLTRAVNAALREASARGDRPPLVYVDAEGYPEAFRLAGRYTVTDGRVTVTANLVRGGAVAGAITEAGDAAAVAALADALVAAAEAALAE